MNLSCLIFGSDGEVCYAEVLRVASLADGVAHAQATLKTDPAFVWFELWLDGERVASSHDQDQKAASLPGGRGILH